ncbi:MAG: pyridoxal 5'-phosphate synthase glutaminase subunit PdxT [Kosmotogaceae bacterium]
MQVGVLGIQGDIQEHLRIVEKLGHKAIWVKNPEQLNNIQALIMPGGESTTMTRLMKVFSLWDRVKNKIHSGMPVFSTCAGMVILSESIENYPHQETMGLLPVRIERNGYGRQVESFETEIEIPYLENDRQFLAVFIRAPRIIGAHGSVDILANYKKDPVLVEYKNILAASFHPELTDDTRIHEYFLRKLDKK